LVQQFDRKVHSLRISSDSVSPVELVAAILDGNPTYLVQTTIVFSDGVQRPKCSRTEILLRRTESHPGGCSLPRSDS
jgi:hypothetical protein